MSEEALSEGANPELESGAYEILRQRLRRQGDELRERLGRLNAARKETFGAIETVVRATERVTTDHNCVPRDMTPVGEQFLFGYNVHLGLKAETVPEDVFAGYRYADGVFHAGDLALIDDAEFRRDFAALYKFYRQTQFVKFARRLPFIYFVFRTGKLVSDVKTFKWELRDDGGLRYLGNRSDHEYRYPAQHEFEWRRATRDDQRGGMHPHVSILDRVFVETVGGDLTIKVEDNTEDGRGIYREPVDDADQTLDDAEFWFAEVGPMILLRIRPYQEEAHRYLVFNEKRQRVVRIDSIGHTCRLLPEDQGVIFANGYLLADGTHKVFDNVPADMLFERRVEAANGEDVLYVFYNQSSGTYVLLSYNLIEQTIQAPIQCHGFSRFDNGEVALFRADEEPRKHHAIQIWQTPYVGANYVSPVEADSHLAKIGNKPIVRAMAECHEILHAIERDEASVGGYVELAQQAGDVIDSYYWLADAETQALAEPLAGIRDAAAAAVEEFEKVERLRNDAQAATDEVAGDVREIIRGIDQEPRQEIGHFVKALAALREVRGRVISLRGRRYVDEAVIDGLETEAAEYLDRLSRQCVQHLLEPKALDPYRARIDGADTAVEAVETGVQGKEAHEAIEAAATELEMLTEIVGNLKIEDPRQSTQILDDLSEIYARLNQVKARLRNRRQEIGKREGAAEFAAQLRLLEQSVQHYLDVCDTPERCDEHANQVMVQIEDLEGRFAEFDEFVLQLTEQREDCYEAFEARKVQLLEARARRAETLTQSAARILKGVGHRAGQLESVSEINGYFASDRMVDKVREIVAELRGMAELVKADDLTTQLKTIQEDTLRQFQDQQDLFRGDGAIALGQHAFSVNKQKLELTVVPRDGDLWYHLNGTGFFERIEDGELEGTRPVWDMTLGSENEQVYRGEYLAWLLLHSEAPPAADAEDLAERVKRFAADRYSEGYAKGVHDHDATEIYRAVKRARDEVGLLRYSPDERAAALFCEQQHDTAEWRAAARSFAAMRALAPDARPPARVIDNVARPFGRVGPNGLQPVDGGTDHTNLPIARRAAEYLFHEWVDGEAYTISGRAAELAKQFHEHLRRKRLVSKWRDPLAEIESPEEALAIARDWATAFIATQGEEGDARFTEELAVVLHRDDLDARKVRHAETVLRLEGLRGTHPRIAEGGAMTVDLHDFNRRLQRFTQEVVPAFARCQGRKADLLHGKSAALKLGEFEPRVLSSFVRNRLLDEVYLPLIGDNLAKQIGTAGEDTRTDRMGLLLLISPPGYGKTTLMEYIANRVGLTFVKVNGPALGHEVTSLDPSQARNAGAREEVEKLNLALEMGDNVMIYLDDIQHCHAEFLQKFISLCDAQRKIEGVHGGESRTYDLRGKKVAVVMAGNPYTEQGGKFRIPDMLANRADTYNLGDMVGGYKEAFEMSYLENAMSSNPVLQKVARGSQKDVQTLIRAAETGTREGIELEGSFTADELEEVFGTLAKLLEIREVVLRVNQQYIASAGQEDAYRTEPVFQLQGSYRNMNRMAEKTLPVMNDQELRDLILGSYESDAQTLTSGAEANLLKFKELMGWLTPEEGERWEDIKRTFQRRQALGGVDEGDKIGQLMAQIGTVTQGLEMIDKTLRAAAKEQPQGDPSLAQVAAALERVTELRGEFDRRLTELAADDRGLPEAVEAKLPEALAEVLQGQYDTMQRWFEPLRKQQDDTHQKLVMLVDYFNKMVDGYNYTLEELKKVYLPKLEPGGKKVE